LKSQDDIDTVPVLPKEGDLAAHLMVEIKPGDRVEIEISPRRPMRAPMLLISVKPRAAAVMVEQVACGNIVIIDTPNKTDYYKFGQQLGSLVTREDPIRILLANHGTEAAKIRASLVAADDRPGSYAIVNPKE
jgi:hypothetical protein